MKILFLLGASMSSLVAQSQSLQTLCFRGATIQVSNYLVSRYTSAGATLGACGSLPPDQDNDGAPDASDCAPSDPSKQKLMTLYPDLDGDEVTASNSVQLCTSPTGLAGYSLTPKGSDCDDGNVFKNSGLSCGLEQKLVYLNSNDLTINQVNTSVASNSSPKVTANWTKAFYLHHQVLTEVDLQTRARKSLVNIGNSSFDVTPDGRIAVFNLRNADNTHDLVKYEEGRYTKLLRTPANKEIYVPQISADGRIVTFQSTATNILPDLSTTAPYTRVFSLNLASGNVKHLSMVSSGYGFHHTQSANGERVAWDFYANIYPQVYLANTLGEGGQMISKNSTGQPFTEGAENPVLSPDGKKIVFLGGAANFPSPQANLYAKRLYLKDLETDELRVIDDLPDWLLKAVRPADANATKYLGLSSSADFSLDGKFVYYSLSYMKNSSTQQYLLMRYDVANRTSTYLFSNALLDGGASWNGIWYLSAGPYNSIGFVANIMGLLPANTPMGNPVPVAIKDEIE